MEHLYHSNVRGSELLIGGTGQQIINVWDLTRAPRIAPVRAHREFLSLRDPKGRGNLGDHAAFRRYSMKRGRPSLRSR